MEYSVCHICNQDLSALEELDQLAHIDSCLDKKIDLEMQKFIQKPVILSDDETLPTVTKRSYSKMPDYDSMTAGGIKEELDRYGMKKNINTQTARQILKEIWLYIHEEKFPTFLEKYTDKKE